MCCFEDCEERIDSVFIRWEDVATFKPVVNRLSTDAQLSRDGGNRDILLYAQSTQSHARQLGACFLI